MKRCDFIIAIDPDVEKSGVATLSVEYKSLKLYNKSFPELIDFLRLSKNDADSIGYSMLVVVEAGWMIRGNWHLSSWERRQRAASKGYDVGRNHETGKKIVEMCKHLGIEVIEHYPLRKCWKGADGKITHQELSKFTGVSGRSNQDARDAGLLAWIVAGLPIKM